MRLSVGKQDSRPEAKAEVIEPRNPVTSGRLTCFNTWKTKLCIRYRQGYNSFPGVGEPGMLHIVTTRQLGRTYSLSQEYGLQALTK